MTGEELQANLATLIDLLSLTLVLAAFVGLSIRSFYADPALNASQAAARALVTLAVSTFSFWLIGYGLAFGHNPTGWFGTNDFAPLRLTTPDSMQLTLYSLVAASVAQIVQGCLGARLSLAALSIVCAGVAGVVMPIFLGWTAAGDNPNSIGWLADFAFIDNAGVGFLHALAGWVALTGALVLGPAAPTTAATSTGATAAIETGTGAWQLLALALLAPGIIGLCIVEHGLPSDSLPRLAVNLLFSACSATLVAGIFSYRSDTIFTSNNLSSGFLAGLIASSSAGLQLEISQAIMNGAIASILVIGAQRFLRDQGIRDANGAIAVHGVAGTWGILALVPFTFTEMHDINRLSVQLVGAVACLVWVGLSTTALFKAIKWTVRRGDYARYSATGSPKTS